MAYAARILADSISPEGVRLTSMEVTFPRIVLAEFNTHRVLSRNSASSRAIPVKKQLQRVLDDPFMPVWWGKNQSGMSAKVELEGEDLVEAQRLWLEARDNAVVYARAMLDIGGEEQGLHKQITNRILEPWMWQTVLCTGTEWSNFYALRCDENAQPEIRVIAEMMQEVMEASTPTPLAVTQWHLPLIQDDERGLPTETLLKVSAGRCARVSYLTHAGVRDIQADVDLHDSLVANGHMSPTEHQAQPARVGAGVGPLGGNLRGWVQYRKTLRHEDDFAKIKAEMTLA